jgi:hypothetical protein
VRALIRELPGVNKNHKYIVVHLQNAVRLLEILAPSPSSKTGKHFADVRDEVFEIIKEYNSGKRIMTVNMTGAPCFVEQVDAPPPAPVSVDAPPPAPVSVDAPPPASVLVDTPPPAPAKLNMPPPAPVPVNVPPPAPVPVNVPPPAPSPSEEEIEERARAQARKRKLEDLEIQERELAIKERELAIAERSLKLAGHGYIRID